MIWPAIRRDGPALLSALAPRHPVRAGEVAREHVLRTGEVIAAVLRADTGRRDAA